MSKFVPVLAAVTVSVIVPLVATCAAIDAIFIFASVAGLRTLTSALPWLTTAVLWTGVAFLAWYAMKSARRAIAGGGGMGEADSDDGSRRAVLMAAAGALDASALNLNADSVAVGAGAMGAVPAVGQVTVEEAEKRMVRQALEKTGGNIQRAATLLGLSRPALYRRMEKYGIE